MGEYLVSCLGNGMAGSVHGTQGRVGLKNIIQIFKKTNCPFCLFDAKALYSVQCNVHWSSESMSLYGQNQNVYRMFTLYTVYIYI